jgi:hypothetical protein
VGNSRELQNSTPLEVLLVKISPAYWAAASPMDPFKQMVSVSWVTTMRAPYYIIILGKLKTADRTFLSMLRNSSYVLPRFGSDLNS